VNPLTLTLPSASRAAHCSHGPPSRMRHLTFLLLHRAHAWMYDGSLGGITVKLARSSGLSPTSRSAPDYTKAGGAEKGMATAPSCPSCRSPAFRQPRSAGCFRCTCYVTIANTIALVSCLCPYSFLRTGMLAVEPNVTERDIVSGLFDKRVAN
jgi:hypothetical protein